MKKFFTRSTILITVAAILCLALGIGSVAYGASLFGANSPIRGAIIVNPYNSGGGGGGGPTPTPTPTPVYSATITDTIFNQTVAAGSNHIGTINAPTTVTVWDTSTNGHLSSIQTISLNGTLPQGLGISLAPTDSMPILFDSNRTATVHFILTGQLPEGIYDLSAGIPVFTMDCY